MVGPPTTGLRQEGILNVTTTAEVSQSGVQVEATVTSGSVTLTIFEDTDANGTTDNIETIDVLDGTNEYNTTNLALSSGSQYKISIESNPASEEDKNTVSRVTITTSA